MKHTKKGFTFIELLVVIAIIGILSTLAVVSLGNARIRARDTKRLADMRSLQSALEIYYTDQQSYPTAPAANLCTGSDTTLEGCCLNNVSGGGWLAGGTCTAGSTLITMPTDPRNQGPDDYIYTGGGTSYAVNFVQESPTGTLAANNCLSPTGMVADATPDATCP